MNSQAFEQIKKLDELALHTRIEKIRSSMPISGVSSKHKEDMAFALAALDILIGNEAIVLHIIHGVADMFDPEIQAIKKDVSPELLNKALKSIHLWCQETRRSPIVEYNRTLREENADLKNTNDSLQHRFKAAEIELSQQRRETRGRERPEQDGSPYVDEDLLNSGVDL